LVKQILDVMDKSWDVDWEHYEELKGDERKLMDLVWEMDEGLKMFKRAYQRLVEMFDGYMKG